VNFLETNLNQIPETTTFLDSKKEFIGISKIHASKSCPSYKIQETDHIFNNFNENRPWTFLNSIFNLDQKIEAVFDGWAPGIKFPTKKSKEKAFSFFNKNFKNAEEVSYNSLVSWINSRPTSTSKILSGFVSFVDGFLGLSKELNGMQSIRFQDVKGFSIEELSKIPGYNQLHQGKTRVPSKVKAVWNENDNHWRVYWIRLKGIFIHLSFFNKFSFFCRQGWKCKFR
jgi:hypothetical protein